VLKFWKLDQITTNFYKAQYVRDQMVGRVITLENLVLNLITLELWKDQPGYQSVLINYQNHQFIFTIAERLAVIVDPSIWLQLSQDAINLSRDYDTLFSEFQSALDVLLVSGVHQQ
jgi:hypothetical protein